MEVIKMCEKCGNHINDLPYLSEVDYKTIICKKCYEEEKHPEKSLKTDIHKKILLVEDGSVDVDKLEQDGFYVIIYRQGSKPPILLEATNE